MTRLQEIRHECLLQLYGSGRLALTPGHIRKQARRQGYDYTEEEIRNALYFLDGQGLCEGLVDVACGEARYRITSAGMLHYEQTEGE